MAGRVAGTRSETAAAGRLPLPVVGLRRRAAGPTIARRCNCAKMIACPMAMLGPAQGPPAPTFVWVFAEGLCVRWRQDDRTPGRRRCTARPGRACCPWASWLGSTLQLLAPSLCGWLVAGRGLHSRPGGVALELQPPVARARGAAGSPRTWPPHGPTCLKLWRRRAGRSSSRAGTVWGAILPLADGARLAAVYAAGPLRADVP